MKKTLRFLLPLVFVLQLMPLLHFAVSMLSDRMDAAWHLSFSRYPAAYALLVLVLSTAAAVLRRRIPAGGKFSGLISLLLLPLSLMNVIAAALCAGFACAVMPAATCVSVMIAAPRPKLRPIVRIPVRIACVPLAALAVVILTFSFFISDFGHRVTVRQAVSPDGAYTASLTDIDEGALGGSTQLEIMRRPAELIFGTFTAEYHDRIYDWRGMDELSRAQLEWKDENTLIFDGAEITLPAP